MIQLAWGTGMRKMEIFRLRIKDIDFERRSIIVREGKGRKDRVTVLPECTIEELTRKVRQSLQYHNIDVEEGFSSVEMPYALEKKYPNQEYNQHWEYIFLYLDEASTHEVVLRCGITYTLRFLKNNYGVL